MCVSESLASRPCLFSPTTCLAKGALFTDSAFQQNADSLDAGLLLLAFKMGRQFTWLVAIMALQSIDAYSESRRSNQKAGPTPQREKDF